MDKGLKVEFPIAGKFAGVENVGIKGMFMIMKVPFYGYQSSILYS